MNCVCVFFPIPPTSLRTRPSTSKGRLFRGCFHCSAVILLLLLVILRNRCFWYRSRECHVNFVLVCTLHNSYVYLITSSTASSLYPFTTIAIHPLKPVLAASNSDFCYSFLFYATNSAILTRVCKGATPFAFQRAPLLRRLKDGIVFLMPCIFIIIP